MPPETTLQAGAGNAGAAGRDRGPPSAVDDLLDDQLSQRDAPPRDRAEGRRWFTAHVLAAAALHRFDPERFFASIAAEPRFKGKASGLSQQPAKHGVLGTA
jgi:hypothetical protein